MLSSAAVRKMTIAPASAVRVISVQRSLSSLVSHPVLCVEQDVAVDGSGRLVGQEFGVACVVNLDTLGIVADRLIGAGIEVGWQLTFVRQRIATAEGLPGEVVFPQREVAGKLFQAVAQHGGERLLAAEACKLVELLRRDAKPEKRFCGR